MITLTKKVPQKVKTYLKTYVPSYIPARMLARDSKRLDICAAQFAMWFHLSGRGNLKNKVCMEVGSGWVLSHALICHLLGAKHVYATDISPIANPSTLKIAIHSAIPSIIRDTLSPFCGHEEIRDRLDRLLAIDNFSFKTLEEIGIEYIAPFDLARDNFDDRVDFLYSNSVLEHVPINDIQIILKKMASILNQSGHMIHAIHLEDHNGDEQNPFEFLSESDENYPPYLQTQRGNRIRKSQWLKNVQMIEELEFKVLFEFQRHNAKIPDIISPSINYVDENDLRVTHLGLLLTKK